MKKTIVNFTNPSKQKLNNLLEYYKTGQYNNAEKLSKLITQEFPQHQFAWKVLDSVLKQTGRLKESLVASQKSAQLGPQDAEAHNNLGGTLLELKRLEEAEISFKQAILIKPDYAVANYNLGNTLQALGRSEEAEASFKQAISLKPDYFIAYNNLGNTLKGLRRLEEAEVSYRQAISIKHDLAITHNNLGNTLQELGRFEEAEASFKEAISINPDYAEAHRHLTVIKKFNLKDKQYLKMQELYHDKNISEEQLCHINFGLAKACEDLKNFEEAFKHYKQGNQLRKSFSNYNISQDIELFNQLKNSFPLIEQNSLKLENLKRELMPIFIVGMPRSGTTLVEQIISSHSEVTGGGELFFIDEFGGKIAQGLSDPNKNALLNFRKRYLVKLNNFSLSNSIVTDKMPLNFRYIGLLLAAFPEAKIVHTKRDPTAVCWSNYKHYFVSKKMNYSYKLNYVIKYYELYKNLMKFWTKQFPNKIYDIDYELLTVKQEEETRKLINYIGLNWDDKCFQPQNNTRSIGTASAIQVREKVYQGSSQQWKKYKPFLKGAFDHLANVQN